MLFFLFNWNNFLLFYFNFNRFIDDFYFFYSFSFLQRFLFGCIFVFLGFRFIFWFKYSFWTIIFDSDRLIFWNYINFIYSNIRLWLYSIFIFLCIFFRDFNGLFSFYGIFISFNLFNIFFLQDFRDYDLWTIIFNSNRNIFF